MINTFLFAILILFLTLAAQFESFRDPIVILVSVPMSIAGALIFIFVDIGGASLDIYTQVGLITLIGLVSKHGIPMVEFANEAQAGGLSKHDAIVEAATVCFRPIPMTTAAMVLGVVPLIPASGAGANSCFATGMSIGTRFTLLVVPAFYMMIAADRSEARRARGERGAGPLIVPTGLFSESGAARIRTGPPVAPMRAVRPSPTGGVGSGPPSRLLRGRRGWSGNHISIRW
jgi:predicted RND superfamily exporter protein